MGAHSFRSPPVQLLRGLIRRRNLRWEQRRFVAEGAKVVGEALSSGAHPEIVYLDPAEAGADHLKLAERCQAAGAELVEVAPGVLARACDAVTPQPIAAVVRMLDVPLEAVSTIRSLVLVCVGLQDPGNAGTIVRSALAAEAGAVIFSAGAVDIFNPKAVRASAGAIFHLPIVAGPDAEMILTELGGWGRRRLATVARGGQDYTRVDLATDAAIVLGSESHGLPAGVTGSVPERRTGSALLDGCVSIPMAPTSESLNVAMAATVLAFEAARQRRFRA